RAPVSRRTADAASEPVVIAVDLGHEEANAATLPHVGKGAFAIGSTSAAAAPRRVGRDALEVGSTGHSVGLDPEGTPESLEVRVGERGAHVWDLPSGLRSTDEFESAARDDHDDDIESKSDERLELAEVHRQPAVP